MATKEEILAQAKNVLRTEVVDRHSFFQLQHFVIGKEPTHQARLWRCVREIKARSENLDALKLEIDDKKDSLRLSELDFEMPVHVGDEFEQQAQERIRIHKRQIKRKMIGIEHDLQTLEAKQNYLLEEIEFFIRCYAKLSETEKLKPWDDTESQKEYWNAKLSQEMSSKLLMRLPVDTELLKTILALHDSSPVKQETIKLLEEIKQEQMTLSVDEEVKQFSLNP